MATKPEPKKCPTCGDQNHLYARADIRWEDGRWEINHIEEQLECTECDAEFYYGEAGFGDLPEIEVRNEPLVVFVVEGEHPFDPYYPTDIFVGREGADHRAADLTRTFLAAYWDIKHGDEPLLPIPDVTDSNWLEIVEKYGADQDFMQQDQWGRWWVDVTEKEVIDG